jgi:hypothetical protein
MAPTFKICKGQVPENVMRDELTGLHDNKMTKLDWVKAILGGIFMTAFIWGFTAFMFVL